MNKLCIIDYKIGFDYICGMRESYSWTIGWITFGVLISLTFFPSNNIQAQINPPDFICVDNDTLKWVEPMNNCGPFISYDIYLSDDINGPYTLLANVTDPNQTDYFHMNANSSNNLWYYYILSNYDCPGLPSIPSDTLDNRDPDFPPIDAVTVNNGQVEIYWSQSEAPETAGYVIYHKGSNGNFEPINTVSPETTTYYTDVSADPNSAAQEYTIVAIDHCGNTSVFNAPQASIFSTVEIDPCTQSALINWNLYENWAEGIENQEIWLGINGNAPMSVDTVSAIDTSYVYQGLDDGNTYCFFVRANRNNSPYASNSNEVCLTASIIQPNRNLALQAVSFTPDDRIELIWRWDTNAEINTVNILSSSENSNYSNINSSSPDFPLTATDTFYVNNHNGNQGKEFFKISTIDDCDTTSISNYGATIFLSGETNEDKTNTLDWTAFDIENGTVLEYRIYKQNAVNEFVLAQVGPSELSYLDIDIDKSIYGGNSCYFVAAYSRIALGDGTVAYSLSRSNTICLEQSSNLQFPNAFAPNGKNNIFKPLISFPSLIASYELRIFDRWGKLLFNTNDPEDGWNGQSKGKDIGPGAYVYAMKLKQTDGRMIEQKGTVIMIR